MVLNLISVRVCVGIWRAKQLFQLRVGFVSICSSRSMWKRFDIWLYSCERSVHMSEEFARIWCNLSFVDHIV